MTERKAHLNYKTVYALLDPKTMEVKYVGCSCNPNRRLLEHCSGGVHDSNSTQATWVESIKPLKPELVVLEAMVGDWEEAEQFWILYLRFLGFELTNKSSGGKGSLGCSPSQEVRRLVSLRHSGKLVSEATRLKLSSAGVGRKHSAEETIKLSERSRGNTYSSGYKNALGYRHTEETKARISATLINNNRARGK